jgi:hypothetical protein
MNKAICLLAWYFSINQVYQGPFDTKIRCEEIRKSKAQPRINRPSECYYAQERQGKDTNGILSPPKPRKFLLDTFEHR